MCTCASLSFSPHRQQYSLPKLGGAVSPNLFFLTIKEKWVKFEKELYVQILLEALTRSEEFSTWERCVKRSSLYLTTPVYDFPFILIHVRFIHF